MARILIVDDEVNLASSIKDWLSIDGHSVDAAHDGTSALEILSKVSYDVLVLDLMLPDIGGIELCRRYRKSGGLARVLILTARDLDIDKEEGFDSGADDYVTKPFNLKEVSARIRALMRRSINIANDHITVGDLVVDRRTHQVSKAGEEIRLLPQEFALLEFLMFEPNKVFSADVLSKRVWRGQSSLETVRTHIKTLRKKIERKNSPPKIETLHGLGYCLRY